MASVEDEEVADIKAIGDRLQESEIASIFRSWCADVAPVRDPITGKFVYAQINEKRVLAEVRQAAMAAVRWAMNDHRITNSPTVIWCIPETDADREYVARHESRDWAHISFGTPILGACAAEINEIWLTATLNPEQAIVVAAHEVRHVAQHSTAKRFAADRQVDDLMCELDARLYANRARRAIRAVAT